MKFCSNCGKEAADQAVVCPYCGCAMQGGGEMDVPSTGLNILSFLIPLLGLILYLAFRDKTPVKAKAAGKFALIGLLVSVGFMVLMYGCSAALLLSM